MLELRNISFAYKEKLLLSDIDFSVPNGQWLVLLGRSGCGKSTLLKAIAGLKTNVQQSGSIHCQAKIAYMAQQDSLLPWLSVLKNIQLADHLHGKNNSQTVARALKLLEQVDLSGYENKAVYELSGGERQRVALARTLMQSAELILMDEPFSAVDAITRMELQKLSEELLADKTVILITHDPQEAIRLADVIHVINHTQLSTAFTPKNKRPRFEAVNMQPELQQRLLAAL